MSDLAVQNVGSTEGYKIRLKNNKGLQEQREAYYVSLFEQQGVNEKTAKKYAKAQLKNDLAKERVEDRVVCYSKDEAEALKKSGRINPDDVSYLSKKQRKVVDRNREDFYTDGKFDSEKYKKHFVDASGEDYCMNDGSNLERPEDHTEAGYLGTSDTRTRRMARKAGLDTTSLAGKRLLHVTGMSAIGSAAGGLFTSASKTKATFYSEANVTHRGDFISDPMKTVVKVGSSVPGGAILGGTLGALAGIATIDAVGGEKDLFNGREPKAIIESGNVKGLDKRIQPFMAAIIADKNLNNTQKSELVEKAIGKNSSSLANRREIAAMYTDFLDASKKAKPAPKPEPKPNDNGNGKIDNGNGKVDNGNGKVDDNNGKKPCEWEPIQDKVDIGKAMYTPKKGECWRDIVVAKYGILPTDKDFNKVLRALKHANGLSDAQCRQNIQPRQMALPDELLGRQRTDAKVKGSVHRYNPQHKFAGRYVANQKDRYGSQDCENKVTYYEDKAKRDKAIKEHNEAK
ncbi:MAG: hypothetical protein LKG27_01435 [Clostridiaceae bacterium]|jgi:hypothetical protein|nr:hypothetical protein [Clostridiaceae bacterium]